MTDNSHFLKVPSNYAPNYPMQQQQQQARLKQQQYGTLPHPQVQMVHPVQQQQQHSQQMDSRTMPRLSSSSMRSTGSSQSSGGGGSDQMYARHMQQQVQAPCFLKLFLVILDLSHHTYYAIPGRYTRQTRNAAIGLPVCTRRHG